MKEKVTIEYRGVTIGTDNGITFIVDGEGYHSSYATLAKACDAIDKSFAVPFTRVGVFWFDREDVYRGTATSINEQGQVFINMAEKKGWGSRMKRGRQEFIALDTPENMLIYEKIQAVVKEWDEVRKTYVDKMNVLRKSMAQLPGRRTTEEE